MKTKLHSVRSRLLVWQSLTVMFSLCMMYVVLFFFVRSYLLHQTKLWTRDKSFVIAGWIDYQDSPSNMRLQLEDYRDSQQNNIAIQAFRFNGTLVGSSVNIKEKMNIRQSLFDSVRTHDEVYVTNIKSKQYGKMIASVGMLYHDSVMSGCSVVAVPLSEINATLYLLLQWMIASLPFAVILSFIGGLFLTKQFIKPFSFITQKASLLIENPNQEKQLPVLNPDDELGHLTITINSLLKKLDNSTKQQLRFVADAAHELRTPITILRGELELSLHHRKGTDDITAMLKSNLEEVNRLSLITDNLILLTRFEAENLFTTKEDVFLPELIDNVISRLTPLLNEHNIKCGIRDTQGPCCVKGNRYYLEQMFYNLIDNAQKYSPSNKTIYISLFQQEGNSCIIIADQGFGISPSDIPHIFDRFSRSNEHRTLPGSGLGLSIVKAIVVGHKGTINVHSKLGIGTTFTIKLPVS